jgi:hypothetical protein
VSWAVIAGASKNRERITKREGKRENKTWGVIFSSPEAVGRM